MNDSDINAKSVNNEARLAGLKKHSRELNQIVVESLQEALLRLLEKKSFDAITVSELCAKAGVSRTAFYGNFKEKTDVLQTIIFDFQRELLSCIGSPFRTAPGEDWFKGLFTLVKERANVLKPIFCGGYQDKYQSLVNAIVLRHKDLTTEQKYTRLAWAGGLVNSIVYWLAHGLEEPIDEMAKIAYGIPSGRILATLSR